MLLPNASLAEASQRKIVDYLLSTTHVDGKGKAKFFISVGFTTDEWTVFRDALLQHCLEHEVVKIVPVEFNPEITNYVIEGDLHTPVGKAVFVRSVCKIDAKDVLSIPHLVSAYKIGARL